MAVVLGVTGVMILANALFVAAEFGSVSARRTRLSRMSGQGSAAAKTLLEIVSEPRKLDAYVAACQVGITLSSLVLGFYGQRATAWRLEGWLGHSGWLSPALSGMVAAWLVLLVLTGLQIVLGELVPRAIAIRHPERLALLTSYPMRVSMLVLGPFIWLFNGAAVVLLRVFGLSSPSHDSRLHAPEEIQLLIDQSSQAGAVGPHERQLLANAFDLSNLVARQVMIPRNRLVLASVDTPATEMLRRIALSPFTRIPVYKRTPDDIVGIVHLKDLFRLDMDGRDDVADAVRRVPVVPETTTVGRLWQLLSQQQSYMAVVLDEQGGTAGIVTQEDLLEEIIGEIHDEFDVDPAAFLRRPGQPPLVRGDLLVAEVNDTLGLSLPVDRSDTIGGLVVDELGRLAETGDEVEIEGVRLLVRSVRRHAIERLAVLAPGGMAGDE